jgi:putative transposase
VKIAFSNKKHTEEPYMNDSNDAFMESFLEVMSLPGNGGFRQMLQKMLDACMVAERRSYLGVGPYERSEKRVDQSNGFKDKSLKTRMGELDLRVPQVRSGSFYPSCLTKGLRSERALQTAMAEMYLNGVATRKVSNIMEAMCGFEVSSQEVSRATATLDEQLLQWRTRPLGEVRYLMLDAIYTKVREGGSVIDSACLIAIGIAPNGTREILGTALELGEHESCWRSFMKGLQERGMHGVTLIVSDDHAGLKAARKTVFPSVPWQRCQFHMQQNAQSYVPKTELKPEVAADIRAIFNAASLEEAERLIGITSKKYEKSAPRLASWLEENIREGLTVFNLPIEHRKRMRTSNMLERLNEEVRRRIKVITSFPNKESALRLMSFVLMERGDDWGGGRKYVTFN